MASSWKGGPEPDLTSSLPGMGIWGWMSPTELLWLGSAAARMETVAEVGCLHGRSAFMLLTACPGTVYCIDPWEDEADHSYASFMSYCGHFPNLAAIRGRSPDAASGVGDVDMTFLDGAHAYGAVLADIAAWLPKTRRLLCGHDYQIEDAGFPGSARSVSPGRTARRSGWLICPLTGRFCRRPQRAGSTTRMSTGMSP